ncbi:MAG: hypothetical protein ACLUBZ_16475 [Ruthenibacterium lactatiformans]|uniref:hypothetical protein n=1 Tax=Ruthenibacterium lactatiformans TaxID=1550024 RepID=UPI00399632F5
MLAAVLADGNTVIEKPRNLNVDLANFLNSMGADIRGAGTDVIKVRVPHAGRFLLHHPRPDRSRHLYGRRGGHRR